MAKANLKVMLLRATPDPDEIVALGARLCYAQADLDTLRERVQTHDQQKYIAGVMERGHLSVTEHASFTFAVEGVSRLRAIALHPSPCRASAMCPWRMALIT